MFAYSNNRKMNSFVRSESDMWFFAGRSSGKTTRCIQKFIEHYPDVLYVVSTWRQSSYILEEIIKAGISEKMRIQVAKRIIPPDNLRQRLLTVPREFYKIIDDAWLVQDYKYPVDDIAEIFDYVTSSDGEFIDLFLKYKKKEILDEIERL